jgi:glycosyltransferase involved in cell wall biosynthesis
MGEADERSRFAGGLSLSVDSPLVSIVTPVFNGALYIRETIESLCNQSYGNFEHIVVDGGSTDGTLDILRKYADLYPLRWISERDNGQSDAINKGMRMASGRILAYLNADDFYYPETLSRVVEFFSANPDKGFMFGRCNVINSDGRFSHDFEQSDHLLAMPLEERRHPSFVTLLRKNSGVIPQPSSFWRREVMEKVGFFDESFHYAMDYEYWLRVTNEFKVGFIDHPLSAFRMHPSSKSGSLMVHKFMFEAIRAARLHGGTLFCKMTWVFLKLYLMAPSRRSAYRNLIRNL